MNLALVARHDARLSEDAAEALARLQTSIDLFRAFAMEEHVSAEVLVAEYNVVADDQSLAELLQRRTERTEVPLRVITIPYPASEQAISHFRWIDAGWQSGSEGSLRD